MNQPISVLHQFSRDEQGAASVEYAILAAAIVAVITATVVVIGTQTNAAFCAFLVNFGGSC